MRKMMMMVLVALLLLCTVACAEVYPMAYTVVEVNQQEDVMVLETFNGEQWVWEGVEDWMVGDVAAGLVDDCGTRYIYDDEILELRYCGYLTNS